MDEDGDNLVGDDESAERRIISKKKKGESNKQRMAQLVTRIVYQLEKMRYILEKNIYPRDTTLRLFDSPEHEDDVAKSLRKFSSVNKNDRHLLLAYKLLHMLHKKIQDKMQTTNHSMLI